MLKFYGHFAAAYGTIWLVLFSVALLTQSHIDAGMFGMCGFPVIAGMYAAVRVFLDNSEQHYQEQEEGIVDRDVPSDVNMLRAEIERLQHELQAVRQRTDR